MKNDQNFSIMKRLKSFSYAFRGILTMLRNEHNSRIHLLWTVIALAFGFIYNIAAIEWMILIILLGLVWFAELINSAIEELANEVDEKHNKRIGLVKDYASGAVLIAALVSFVVGLIIFVPKVFAL